jgi:hypothetical protein
MPSLEEFNEYMLREMQPRISSVDSIGRIQLHHFIGSIKKVERITPETFGEDAFWRFHMELGSKRHIIDITTVDLTKGFTKFNNAYMSNFGLMLPYELCQRPKKNEPNYWVQFVGYICSVAVEAEQTETDASTHLEIILRRIAQSPVTEDKLKWVDEIYGQHFLLKWVQDDIVYYLLKSRDVEDFIKDLKITTPLEKLGKMMAQKRYKKIKNRHVYLGMNKDHKEIRLYSIWWITEECLKQYGLDPQNPNTEDITAQKVSNLEEIEF